VIKIEVEAREASEMTKTSENNKLSQASGNSRPRNQTQLQILLSCSKVRAAKSNVFSVKTSIILPHAMLSRIQLNEGTFWYAITDVLTVCDLVTRRRNAEIRKHVVTVISGIINRFVRCVTKEN